MARALRAAMVLWCLCHGLAAGDMPFAVAIDGDDTGIAVRLRQQGGALLIDGGDAVRLGLAVDAAAPIDLRRLRGFRIRLDPEHGRVELYRRPSNGNGNGNGGGNGNGHGNGAAIRPVVVDVAINGRMVQRAARAFRADGRFLFEPGDVVRWRLAPGVLPTVVHRDRPFAAAGSGTPVAARFDARAQQVDLVVPADARTDQPIAFGRPPRTVAATPSTGAFLNYDLHVEAGRGGGFGGQLLEGGVFTPLGVLLTTVLGQQSFGADGDDRSRFVRLETSFVQDDPETRRTLRLGDAVTVPGDWSRPVRFGGVQWGRNFALDPGFVPYPLPAFAGRAGVPSTLDVFIDDALRFRSRVDDGPFTISQVPVVTGGGIARLVVRDAIGREQVVSLPFYVSTRLLREGLDAWSLEAGFLRRGFQQRSFAYGEFLTSGTYRYGVDDRLTVEAHAELSLGRQAAGGSLGWLWPEVGEFSLSLAGSLDEGEAGTLVGAGFQRSFAEFGLAARHTERFGAFRDLGVDPRFQIRSETQVTASLPLGAGGMVSATVARQTMADEEELLVGSLNYAVPLFGRVHLNLFALHTENGRSATTVGFNLAVPLGPGETVQAGARQGRDGRQTTVDYVRQAPFEGGLGIRATAERGIHDRLDALLEWDSPYGRFGVGAGVADDRAAARLSASGGVVAAGGGLFLARRIDDGFAVVTVPDQPDVRVYHENRLVGRTDEDGRLLVPRLLSYEPNRLSIDVADLPIRATVGRDRIEVAPGWRSGAVVRFPVDGLERVIVRLLRDGRPVTPGSRVADPASGTVARVATDGEALLAVPADHGGFVLEDADGGCAFAVPAFVRRQAAIPRVTVEVCR